jgi:hypothetical protein
MHVCACNGARPIYLEPNMFWVGQMVCCFCYEKLGKVVELMKKLSRFLWGVF